MPIFEDKNDLVELRAVHAKLLTGNFVADIATLAIVRHPERLERRFLRIDFIVAAAPRQARIKRPVLLNERFEMRNDVSRQALKILARLGEISFDPLGFFAMLV